MTKGYRIRVVGERASDMHRTRNRAEELHVEFTARGYGTTSDPDTMTTEFQINVAAKRNLGDRLSSCVPFSRNTTWRIDWFSIRCLQPAGDITSFTHPR